MYKIGDVDVNNTLYIVVPCYNEQEVLPDTSVLFLNKIKQLISAGKISDKSKVLFVDDGSRDKTWDIIKGLSRENKIYCGIQQSRNRGHQNAILAGMIFANKYADAVITIDCDGQDDINAMDEMVDDYLKGFDVVYGVRSKRDTDTFFKKVTAQSYYKLLSKMGAEVVYNHADYRLLSKRVINELINYKEVNLYLRGLIPLIGFKSSIVYYERHERIAGESHYPIKKMLGLAIDGITSLSTKPIRMISECGFLISLLSFLFLIFIICSSLFTHTAVQGWTSMVCIITFLGGIQLIGIGVLGEYIGKVYLEVKQRPRYIISEATDNIKNL